MPPPQPLTPRLLVAAYCQGLFPMARNRRGPIDWYSPDMRAILPLSPPEAFCISKSLNKRVRKGEFRITFDQAFETVMRACAEPRKTQRQTWISHQIIKAYCELHQAGLAHSVEAWTSEGDKRVLVGGLYGVALGGAYFGESMFTRQTDASKVCLVHLVNHLRQRGYVLLDTQIINPHMTQFGAIEIPRDEYLRRLEEALQLDAQW